MRLVVAASPPFVYLIGMLEASAVHPKLEAVYDQLVGIALDRPGLLGDYPVLATYLTAQLRLLRERDTMFAHDFTGDPRYLTKYAVGEMHELVEEIPTLSPKAATLEPEVASKEAGDVLWFLSMRVALANLEPIGKGLSPEETRFITGALGIINGIATIDPRVDPERLVDAVVKKNVINYPSRTLRARINDSPELMGRLFVEQRLPKLKGLRAQLPGRVLTPSVHRALQTAKQEMPEVPEALPGAGERYAALVPHVQLAGLHYAYDDAST